MSLAAKLKELRLRKGESLQQVAEAVDISKTHVYDLEKGNSKNPSVELLKKYSDHFGVPIKQLVGEDLSDEEDPAIVNMFRQVKELEQSDQKLLNTMVQEMLKRKKERDSSD